VYIALAEEGNSDMWSVRGSTGDAKYPGEIDHEGSSSLRSHLLGSPPLKGAVASLPAWYHGIVRIACWAWGLPVPFLVFS